MRTVSPSLTADLESKSAKQVDAPVLSYSSVDNAEQTIKTLDVIKNALEDGYQVEVSVLSSSIDGVGAFLLLDHYAKVYADRVAKPALILKVPQSIGRMLTLLKLEEWIVIECEPSSVPFSETLPFAISRREADVAPEKDASDEDAGTLIQARQRDELADKVLWETTHWLEKRCRWNGQDCLAISTSLSHLLVELLGNAEEHGAENDGLRGGWSFVGFWSHECVDDKNFAIGHFAVVNVGRTISEALVPSLIDDPEFSPVFERYLKLDTHVQDSESAAVLFAFSPGTTSADIAGRGLGLYTAISDLTAFNRRSGDEVTAFVVRTGKDLLHFEGQEGLLEAIERVTSQEASDHSGDTVLSNNGPLQSVVQPGFDGTVIGLRLALDLDADREDKSDSVQI